MNSQIKMREEENSMEEINPWNGEINLLVRMLNSHDLIMKKGKDDREVVSKASKPKNEASKREVNIRDTTSVETRASKPKFEAIKVKVSIEDSNSNLKQGERDRNTKQNMDQPKDMLDIEIEEMWQLMV